jgi:demethylmenaquinone methyltransferase/2-methoxy-6-polyprenyl-1,4-benzoquinol methylase
MPYAPSPKLSPFGKIDLDHREKPRRVRDLFTGVAANYDVMNDLMSGGVHRLWKDYFVEFLNPADGRPLLDVAGGTGDIAARFLANGGKSATVVDPTAAMMDVGRKKHSRLPITWICAPAEHLPLPDRSFAHYTISFGLRNVTDIKSALAEAYRVLDIGGQFLCLEFSRPELPGLARIYDIYSDRILPWLGEMVANDRPAYQYLVESIRRFPPQSQLADMMADAGFSCIRYINLSGGICAIHQGYKL